LGHHKRPLEMCKCQKYNRIDVVSTKNDLISFSSSSSGRWLFRSWAKRKIGSWKRKQIFGDESTKKGVVAQFHARKLRAIGKKCSEVSLKFQFAADDTFDRWAAVEMKL
jgi:hypothetical protein